jgi:hypothetical protein
MAVETVVVDREYADPAEDCDPVEERREARLTESSSSRASSAARQ